MNRPQPPNTLFAGLELFEPDDSLEVWVKAAFMDAASPAYNPDHDHLLDAHIGFVWTNVEASRQMNRIVGQAEMPRFMGSKWSKRRQEQQIEQWFGDMPDFMITLDAVYARECDDVTFCAIIEHELYHCAQELDVWGAPKFSKTTGKPVYAIKGHDVEEFVGVVRRYGVGAAAGKTLALVEAARGKPHIGRAEVTGVCGSCKLSIV